MRTTLRIKEDFQFVRLTKGKEWVRGLVDKSGKNGKASFNTNQLEIQSGKLALVMVSGKAKHKIRGGTIQEKFV